MEAGFRIGRGTRNQIANIHWIIEKAREFQKNIHYCFTDGAKAFDCVDHNKSNHTRTIALSNSVKLSHALWGHPRWGGHGREV